VITVVAVIAGAALVLALGVAAAVDAFRQTGRWSARHDTDPWRWSRSDDVEIERWLQHPSTPSEASNGSAVCSEE
jgi:hypothetical protein